MKRSEFLKRLGLSIGAAVAAPALLKGEEEAPKSACNHVDAKDGEDMTFWRSSDKAIISSAFTIDIPPLKEGEYKYELTLGDKPILSGNIKAE